MRVLTPATVKRFGKTRKLQRQTQSLRRSKRLQGEALLKATTPKKTPFSLHDLPSEAIVAPMQRARALTGSLLPSELELPPLIPFVATWADFVATHFAQSVRQCQ